MSNPTPPTPPQPEDSPSQPADATAPEAASAADAQPTEVYPPADAQHTEVYPPSGQPEYGQPVNASSAYGQPAYGAPVAEAPAYVAPGSSAADRPRRLGWISLGLAIGGLVLVGAAFIPIIWVNLILAIVGGLLLFVALILGIVTLASKKQGGKGLGIGAIVVSVLGGFAWIGAITLAFLLISVAVATSAEPAPSSSAQVTPEDDSSEEEVAEEPTGTYDEAAYLAQVRPELTALMQEVDPNITEEMLSQIYTDEMLVSFGESFLMAGEAGEAAFTSSLGGENGLLTDEQAWRFYNAIMTAAEQHLVE